MSLIADIRPDPTLPQYVFLVEDSEPMRDSLTKMLEFLGYSVQSFSSADEFLQASIQACPAVIITDMRMPQMTGVELQAELIKRGRQMPIIFISGESTMQQSINAMKQGAIEFLIKPFEQDQLIAAVVRGLEQDAINMRKFIELATLKKSLEVLAPREREVFELLTLGFNNSEIQEKLQISLSTTKQYKLAVMRKLNLQSLSHLIALSKK